MADETSLSTLLDALDRLAKQPRIPASAMLWNSADIADYLRRSRRSVTDDIVTLPGFPQAIRVPSQHRQRGRRLWKASEVIEWTERHQERPRQNSRKAHE